MNSQNAQPLNKTKIILIDNFDSFTYNLVNQLSPLVNTLKVFRNNTSLEQLANNELGQSTDNATIIVLSPGPGNPDNAGITLEIIERYKGKLPILGICLGHQAIVQSYQGVVGPARSIVHGKADDIHFCSDETQIFAGLETPFRAARYHSLVATKISDELKIIATAGKEVMAVKHKKHKVLGFQFHPESILTPKGTQLMKQSLQWLSAKEIGTGF